MLLPHQNEILPDTEYSRFFLPFSCRGYSGASSRRHVLIRVLLKLPRSRSSAGFCLRHRAQRPCRGRGRWLANTGRLDRAELCYREPGAELRAADSSGRAAGGGSPCHLREAGPPQREGGAVEIARLYVKLVLRDGTFL